MTRETRIADVEAPSGWWLQLFELAPSGTPRLFRAELRDPDGRLVHVAALQKSVEDCLESVASFLMVERLPHVGTALATMVRGELK